jgi:hemerythrin superfamily protein
MAADSGVTTGEDAVAILMNDHRQIKGLFDKLLQGDGSTRTRIIDALKPLLVVHNATEENVVYPAIHSIAQRPHHANGLYHQQDAAEIAFFELGMVDPGDPEFIRKAADLRDALLAHVLDEEDTEFPYLREAMTPEAMRKLTADVREFRAAFGGAAFR